MEEQKGFICWIKKHKKELALAGLSISALIIMILGIKNGEKINALWAELRDLILQSATQHSSADNMIETCNPHGDIQKTGASIAINSKKHPYEVNRHIRNLPAGWHASQEKISDALKNNIILKDGQTWVEAYIKGNIAA